MNDFGVDLTGKTAIYTARCFWKKNGLKEERTFICESGPGCEAKGGGLPGLLFGARTIRARFPDGAIDTISSLSIEAYIDDEGNEVPTPFDDSPGIEELANVVRLEGEEKPKVFIPVKPTKKATATGRLAKTESNMQNIPIRTEMGAEIRKAFVGTPAIESPTTSAGNRQPRQAREEIVSSPEFIALFEKSRAAFKDPSRAFCKRGHAICAGNAHVGDMRRPPHRYSCDPCLRKEPACISSPAPTTPQ